MTRGERICQPERWQRARDLARGWIDGGQLTALSCLSGLRDQPVQQFHLGTRDVAGVSPLPPEPIYLVASITKPIVVMGAMLLVEQGKLTLGDRVTDYFPEFGRHGKYGVEVRHLMTHTSGLPDMVPANADLRAAHAPLAEFFAHVCDQPLAFVAGRNVQYQSTGLLVLAEIMARVSGRACSTFLREEIFEPLGMTDTVLGAPDSWFAPQQTPLDRVVEVRLSASQQAAESWNWNSRYWRQLGAPWGGLLTTAADLARLARCLLQEGRLPSGKALFSPDTIAAATRNQLEPLRDIPEVERRCRPWGLGWRLQWPAHSANFGDLMSPQAYGHWGATGTLMWVDPESGVYTIILSNEPQEPHGYFLSRLSSVVSSAWV